MREPHFWTVTDRGARASAPITRLLLTPVSTLYAALGARRIAKASPFKADIPVICVGNLTLGGTGKTPVAENIRSLLTERGMRAATLSRGYRGKLKGPIQVDPALHTAQDVGDEPLLLAQSGEAWIGADRAGAARTMQAAGVEAIVMDDGHQNPSLYKDLSLVVVDGGNPVGNGFVFPKGPLREPVNSGLQRADGVIWIGSQSPPPGTVPHHLPLMRAQLAGKNPPPQGPLIAFAGIGRPQKFFDTLAEGGGDLSETVPFPDHHAFTAGDVRLLQALASERGARLVTTTKDHVRLPLSLREETVAFEVALQFEGQSQSVLDALLADALKPAR